MVWRISSAIGFVIGVERRFLTTRMSPGGIFEVDVMNRQWLETTQSTEEEKRGVAS